eukprot:458972-Amphidinium_carterae.1
MLLGAYTTQGQGVSRASEHEWTQRLLAHVFRLAQLRPAALTPGDFISVNLNHNAKLPAHRDRHNLNETWLATCGHHTGGALWIEAVGEELERFKDKVRPLPPPVRGASPEGLLGMVWPLQGTWTRFSGLRWHAILPSRGERYSVSLFSPRHLGRLQDSHWRLLEELGFHTQRLRELAQRMDQPQPRDQKTPLLPQDEEAPPTVGARTLPRTRGAPRALDAETCPPPKKSEELRKESASRPASGPLESCSTTLTRRLRRQGGSSFCFFMTEVVKRCSQQCPDTSQCRPAVPASRECFLPWGCPYPDVWNGLAVPPTSRRRRQRWKREHDLRELVNVTVLFLNWLHGNSRFEWPLVAEAATPCSENQWRHLQPLRDQLDAWSRSDVPLPSDGGLPSLLAAIRERTQKTGDLQSYSSMSLSDEIALACASGTRKLTADTMALPTISGQTPLVVPTVPVEVELALAREGGFQNPTLPSQISRTYTSISSWPEISGEMIARRLVTLLPPKETCHFNGRRVTAGLFGVEKKGTHRSRVIVDRRAQNDLELNLRDVVLTLALQGEIEPDRAAYLLRLMTLPYAAQFTKLLMTRTSRLAISTEDAADYYYHLKLPLAAVRTNCVGPLLSSEDLAEGSASQ